jgi:hypothetical protein
MTFHLGEQMSDLAVTAGREANGFVRESSAVGILLNHYKLFILVYYTKLHKNI